MARTEISAEAWTIFSLGDGACLGGAGPTVVGELLGSTSVVNANY